MVEHPVRHDAVAEIERVVPGVPADLLAKFDCAHAIILSAGRRETLPRSPPGTVDIPIRPCFHLRATRVRPSCAPDGTRDGASSGVRPSDGPPATGRWTTTAPARRSTGPWPMPAMRVARRRRESVSAYRRWNVEISSSRRGHSGSTSAASASPRHPAAGNPKRSGGASTPAWRARASAALTRVRQFPSSAARRDLLPVERRPICLSGADDHGQVRDPHQPFEPVEGLAGMDGQEDHLVR